MHLGSFYLIIGLCVPVVLSAVEGATRRRWAGAAVDRRLFDFLAGAALDLPAGSGAAKAGAGAGAGHQPDPARVSALAAAGGAGARRLVLAPPRAPGTATVVGGALLFTAIFLGLPVAVRDVPDVAARAQLLLGRALLRLLDAAVRASTAAISSCPRPARLTVGWLIAAVVGTGLSIAAGRAAGRWLARLRR